MKNFPSAFIRLSQKKRFKIRTAIHSRWQRVVTRPSTKLTSRIDWLNHDWNPRWTTASSWLGMSQSMPKVPKTKSLVFEDEKPNPDLPWWWDYSAWNQNWYDNGYGQ